MTTAEMSRTTTTNATADGAEEYWPVTTVASLIDCSVAFVRRAAKRGKFPPPTKLSTRCHRWKKSAVLAWLKMREG